MIKILEKINYFEIFNAYQKIKDEIIWTNFGKCKQAGLQYKNNEDPWISAVGKGDHRDLLHENINPFFKNTYFENLIVKYDLKRTRLMIVQPWSCYSMHKDDTPRIHIPIITNKECYFVFKDNLIEHLPHGNVYWVDTTKYHTFINCSDNPRLHLVGIVKE